MMAFELIVVGASSGGQHALQVVLGDLPPQFPTAVAVVLHRGKESDDSLIRLLQKHSALPVSEAEDKRPILSGHVYLAPPDYHLLVEEEYFVLSVDEPVSYARPSIDVLFGSCAGAYGERVIGVILSGANQDGAQGLAAIKAHGGLAVVQEPATAESRAMPEAAIAATTVDKVLALEEIGPFLADLCFSRIK